MSWKKVESLCLTTTLKNKVPEKSLNQSSITFKRITPPIELSNLLWEGFDLVILYISCKFETGRWIDNANFCCGTACIFLICK